MKKRRIFVPLIALAVVIVAIAAAVLLRKAAPPESVRLLPEAQAYLYVNVGPLRRADIQMSPVQLDPDYAQFVQETGFQFERDLDEAAFAVHVPEGDQTGENRLSGFRLFGLLPAHGLRTPLHPNRARIETPSLERIGHSPGPIARATFGCRPGVGDRR